MKLFFTILTGVVVLTGHAQTVADTVLGPGRMSAEAKARSDADADRRAAGWVQALQLNDTAKEVRVSAVVATHLRAIRDWNNDHPYSTVPAGIDPFTGKPLSNMDRQIIAISAMPKVVHEALMAGLRKDLTGDQVNAILDKYTVGKVAFTMSGYKAIVPDLTPTEEAVILANLQQAREQAVDFKNTKQISAIFEIYKTKCEQYLNSNGRNWHALFKAYVDGQKAKKAVVRTEFIFDTAAFPQSHAATIAETPKGLAAAWFGGTKERNPDVCIYVSLKGKGAASWSAPVNVANGVQNETLRYACWNPVLYQVPGGELLLFYKVGPSPAKCKGWLIRSSDGGVSWSKPRAMPEGFLGPIKDKPVRLADGTLICPSSTEGSGWKVHFELTHDNGKTWVMSGPVASPATATGTGRATGSGASGGGASSEAVRTTAAGEPGAESKVPATLQAIQPTIIFHRDGSLEALCRSENRAILTTTSKDGGKTWSPLAPTALPNNNSGIDAVTLTDGRQLLVYNHVLPPPGMAKGDRSPLNVAVSSDGSHWNAAVVLENDTLGQYSYPAVIQSTDGMVHIVYTWRRKKIKYVEIDPSKLEAKEIVDGRWPSTVTK